MEFSNLGKHCSEPTCRQKDFLPFNCKFCLNMFCLDHRETKEHKCPKANQGDIRAIVCPGCLKSVKYDVSIMNETEAFDVHYATECTKDYDKAKADKNRICEAPKCHTKLLSVNTYKCDTCAKQLCLAHRYQDKHDCRRVYRGGPVVVDDSHLFRRAPAPTTNKPSIVTANTFQQKSTPPQVQTVVSENCDVCGKNFKNIEELLCHAEQAHYSQTNQTSNLQTNTTNGGVMNPTTTNCKTEVAKEVCMICGRSFTNVDELIFHAQQSHYVNWN